VKICIIGHTGFIGQTVYNELSKFHFVFGISRSESSTGVFNLEFDVVINCAGVSSKYNTKRHPFLAFKNECDILNLISKIRFKKLIHVSSIDAKRKSKYGIIKRIVELIIHRRYPNSLILRPAGFVGPNLKKNVVFDIINDHNVYASPISEYNYISTIEFAKIINTILEKEIEIPFLEVGASCSISVREIARILKKRPFYYGKYKETYCVNIAELNKLFQVKTSEEYIEEFYEIYR